MSVWTGDVVVVRFSTSHPTTGAAQDADVLPVGTLVVAGAAMADVVTVADVGIGLCTASVTMPTVVAGQRAQLQIAATVAGVAGVGIVWDDETRNPIGAGLTALGDTRLANLDTAVSSRSTYAGADTTGTTTLLSRLSATRAGYLDNLSAGAVALEATLSTLVASIWTGITGTAANLIADHVLRRTTANVEASANGDLLSARSLYGAVARLVHKVSVSGSTMTSYRADDSTSLTTAALTTDSSAAPTIGIDPAA